ncbi:hypothetical protein AAE478_007479 [Parahypoxylon ruwenzoriense]
MFLHQRTPGFKRSLVEQNSHVLELFRDKLEHSLLVGSIVFFKANIRVFDIDEKEYLIPPSTLDRNLSDKGTESCLLLFRVRGKMPNSTYLVFER